MDSFAGELVRLAVRDASFAAVSCAPIAAIAAFKRSMKSDFARFSLRQRLQL
jgi:predicted dithiol-disulfide oxidoreductase (DUF899 family)